MGARCARVARLRCTAALVLAFAVLVVVSRASPASSFANGVGSDGGPVVAWARFAGAPPSRANATLAAFPCAVDTSSYSVGGGGSASVAALFGGRTGDGMPLGDLYVLDAMQWRWVRLLPPTGDQVQMWPPEQYGARMAMVSSGVSNASGEAMGVLFPGRIAPGRACPRTLHVWDVRSGTWSAIDTTRQHGDMPPPPSMNVIDYFGFFHVRQCTFLLFGDGNSVFELGLEANATVATWRRVATSGLVLWPRYLASAVQLDANTYALLGGRNASNDAFLNDVLLFDAQRRVWSVLVHHNASQAPAPRCAATASLLSSGRILYAGGFPSNGSYALDVKSAHWSVFTASTGATTGDSPGTLSFSAAEGLVVQSSGGGAAPPVQVATFGGLARSGAAVGSSWLLTGKDSTAAWSLVPNVTLSATSYPAAASWGEGRVLFFGGENAKGVSEGGSVLELENGAWNRVLEPSVAVRAATNESVWPPTSSGAEMVLLGALAADGNPIEGPRAVLLGGAGTAVNWSIAYSFSVEDGQWSSSVLSGDPLGPRSFFLFEPLSGSTALIFGGMMSGSDPCNETLLLDASDWTLRRLGLDELGASPPARARAAAAHDLAHRGRVWMFGGASKEDPFGGECFGDLWYFEQRSVGDDGTPGTWGWFQHPRSLDAEWPPGRCAASMAHVGNGVLALFGGFNKPMAQDLQALNDLFLFDTKTLRWRDVATQRVWPEGTGGFAFVPLEPRREVLLAGGLYPKDDGGSGATTQLLASPEVWLLSVYADGFVPPPPPNSSKETFAVVAILGAGAVLLFGAVVASVRRRKRAIQRYGERERLPLLSSGKEASSGASLFGPDASFSNEDAARALLDALVLQHAGEGSGSDGSRHSSESAARAAALAEFRATQAVRFSDLSLGEILGTGGSCTVYRGTWLGAPVAVKRVNTALSADFLREFRAEVTLMVRLRHPNIVQFIGTCYSAPDLYVLTELCDHGDLFHLLHSRGASISLTRRLRLAVDVARGLAYLHECSVLHRDIKSLNCLVTRDLRVKIGDFGLSRLLDRALGSAGAHMTAGVGTVAWSSPELLARQPYSFATDVFSFGVVLWECLTCSEPYPGMTVGRVASHVMAGGRPEVPMHAPAALVDILRACWAEDPAERPLMADVAEDLSAVIHSLEAGS